MHYTYILLSRVFFHNSIFIFDIFKNGSHFQISNELTILDPFKNTMSLLKNMKLDLISNGLIKAIYLGSDENEILTSQFYIHKIIMLII